jgi:hypothetical protein
MIHRNFILTPNSRGIIRTVISRREAACPSAGNPARWNLNPAVRRHVP